MQLWYKLQCSDRLRKGQYCSCLMLSWRRLHHLPLTPPHILLQTLFNIVPFFFANPDETHLSSKTPSASFLPLCTDLTWTSLSSANPPAQLLFICSRAPQLISEVVLYFKIWGSTCFLSFLCALTHKRLCCFLSPSAKKLTIDRWLLSVIVKQLNYIWNHCLYILCARPIALGKRSVFFIL